MNLAFYRICQYLLYLIFKVWNRFEVHGSDNLPGYETGFIIAANHVSYLDPTVLAARFRRPLVFLAKEKLFKKPVLGMVLTLLGVLPVGGANDFRSVRTVIRALKDEKIVAIFPEGTRSLGDEFLDPHPGIAFLAHVAQVPIIPCYIAGTDKAWPRGGRFFKPKKVRVFIGQPFSVGDTSREDRNRYYEECANIVMDRIEALKDAAKGR